MSIYKSIVSRIIDKIDLTFIISLAYLLFIGFIAIYSASSNLSSNRYITTQFVALFIGFIGMFLLVNFNYQYYKYIGKFIYLFSCILLVLVLFFGTEHKGTKGWFDLPFFSFQPVEVTKLMLILSIATFIDKHWKEVTKISVFIKTLCITIIHFLL